MAETCSIGLSIARRLARDGCDVMVSSRKEDHVTHAVEDIRASCGSDAGRVEGVVCNVGLEEHRERLLKETVKVFGGVDYLVSNAAANPHFGPALQVMSSLVMEICIDVRHTYIP